MGRAKSYSYDAAIKEAHAAGLGNREIAAVIGCHHRTVADAMKRLGLRSNVLRGKPPEPVDELHSRCRLCKSVQRNDEFPYVRGKADGRRLSICRKCRKLQDRQAISSSPERYFADRENRMRSSERRGGSRRAHIKFELPSGYLLGLWQWQEGRCFYTDKQLEIELGAGVNPSGASIDRVDSSGNYAPGNVVLCTNRVNRIKQDLTLDEMREWMPGWYERVTSLLPDLVANVTPIADMRPLRVDGTRQPSWVVERRARLDALTTRATLNGAV